MRSLSSATHSGLRLHISSAICLLAILVWAGCNRSSSSVGVEGHVSYRGKPLKSGLVTFFPAAGRPVSATLAEDGAYGAQLEPGDYDVIVGIGVDIPKGYKLGDPPPPQSVVLPAEYTSRAKTTLKASVKIGQTEPIDFDLK